MNFQQQLYKQFLTYDVNQILEVIIKHHGDLALIAEQLDAFAEELDENYAILTLPAYRVPIMIDIPEIEYYELPKTVSFQMRRSMDITCIHPVQLETSYNLTGKGVLIGIIDSGIDYTHPDFRNPDGSTRILYLWDQTAEGSPPSGFRNGHLFTKDDIDRALVSDDPLSIVPEQDIIGHGTAVTGIAAGNGAASDGIEKGAAPEAQLLIIKLRDQQTSSLVKSTDIMRSVKFCLDIAEGLEIPISINISYGTNDGSHNGDSLFERYLDSASEQWKSVICVATGNEGSAGHHFYGKLTQGQTIDVEFAIGENIKQLYLTLWKCFADTFIIEMISPSGLTTGEINTTQFLTRVTLDNVRITVIYGQPSHYCFNQEIYITMEGVNGAMPSDLWQLKVNGVKIVDGAFNIWLPMIDMITNKTFFLVPNVEDTITIPATSCRVISVGGYSALLNTSADFSGRGLPYVRFGQKPDLVAPAVNILTTAVGGGYDVFSGTSVAAPFVTGSAALMMQWGQIQNNDSFLYGQRVKAFLCRNAERNFPVEYPNSIWGYGILDLCSTMDDMVFYKQ